MSDEKWADDSIQFPRLLAELRAFGLTKQQYGFLMEAMDLTVDQIDEVFERAEQEWQRIKAPPKPETGAGP
jgi:hypothetical protein